MKNTAPWAIALLLAVSAVLGACGQKGDLYLTPENAPERSQNEAGAKTEEEDDGTPR